MKVEAICHIPKSNYAYAYRENVLHIRIRTAKNDLEEINLIYGNKFDWKNTQHKQKMRKVASDIYFDYYQSEIQDEDKRIGYYFELVEAGQKIFYTEAGLVKEFNNDLAYCYFYQYPYINPIDVHQQPEWIGDSVFYQIFVERFHNGDPKISPPYLSSWDSEPQPKSFFGGDLQGIIDKLDYLTELGINAIYLTPIFQSPSNHKYDIVNYFEVDPFFGDHKVFKELVNKAHAKGIRIVLDAVFNHCSNHFAPFEDVVQKGSDSVTLPPMSIGQITLVNVYGSGNGGLCVYLPSGGKYAVIENWGGSGTLYSGGSLILEDGGVNFSCIVLKVSN